MKTVTILAIVTIVAAVGMIGASAAVLSQQASAAACNTFVNPNTGEITGPNCSSKNSFGHANTINDHLHIQGVK